MRNGRSEPSRIALGGVLWVVRHQLQIHCGRRNSVTRSNELPRRASTFGLWSLNQANPDSAELSELFGRSIADRRDRDSLLTLGNLGLQASD